MRSEKRGGPPTRQRMLGRGAKLTVIASPPPSLGRASTGAPCAVAIARTIDSPRPWCRLLGGALAQAAGTARTAAQSRPARPARCWRRPRTPRRRRPRCVISTIPRRRCSGPRCRPGSRSAARPGPGRRSPALARSDAVTRRRPATASSAWSARSARSTGSRRSSPRSLVASVSSASSSRSWSRPAAEQLLARRPQGRGARVRVGERDLEQRPLERQRRAQLVRRVGHEPALRLERRLAAARADRRGCRRAA